MRIKEVSKYHIFFLNANLISGAYNSVIISYYISCESLSWCCLPVLKDESLIEKGVLKLTNIITIGRYFIPLLCFSDS